MTADGAAEEENGAPPVKGKAGVGLGVEGHFDTDIYGSTNNKFAGYVTSIPASDLPDVSILHPSYCIVHCKCVDISVMLLL